MLKKHIKRNLTKLVGHQGSFLKRMKSEQPFKLPCGQTVEIVRQRDGGEAHRDKTFIDKGRILVLIIGSVEKF